MSERTRIVFGALMALVGAAVGLTFSEDLGSGFMLVGVGIAIFGLHRFGRSGVDRWQPPTA